jgi:hypothetical protein
MMRVACCAALVAAVACAEPTPPGRGARYSYADTVSGRPIVFHWSAAELPVRYYVPPTGALPGVVARGLAAWEAQFLYGEVHTVLVTDSATADVIVQFADAPPPPAAADPATLDPACTGVTTPVLTAGNDTLALPLRVQVDWLPGYAPGAVWACLERVTLHELGHTLGLFNRTHAGTAAGDVMFALPQVYHAGGRDRATVEVLYHTPRTVTPQRTP